MNNRCVLHIIKYTSTFLPLQHPGICASMFKKIYMFNILQNKAALETQDTLKSNSVCSSLLERDPTDIARSRWIWFQVNLPCMAQISTPNLVHLTYIVLHDRTSYNSHIKDFVSWGERHFGGRATWLSLSSPVVVPLRSVQPVFLGIIRGLVYGNTSVPCVGVHGPLICPVISLTWRALMCWRLAALCVRADVCCDRRETMHAAAGHYEQLLLLDYACQRRFML